jgi:hypothetical protein
VDDNNRSLIVRSLSGLALLELVSGESSGRGLGAVVSLILGSLGGGRVEGSLSDLPYGRGGGGSRFFYPLNMA